MPYLHLIDEAIGLLNTEIRLIEWRIKYPEQLQQRINKQPLSPLYLADKTTLINIMEVVSGLFLSKDIVYQNGKPAYLVDLSKGFEWLFNIKISDCHQKHEDVIKRKPGRYNPQLLYADRDESRFEEACRTYCVKLFGSGCTQIDRREDGTACAGVYA